MRRPRRLLPLLGALFLAAGAMQVWGAADLGARVLGAGVPAGDGDLIAGCRDVPEAVALAETLELRAARMAAYQATLDRSRAEIATAQSTLTSTLRQLKAVRDAVGATRDARRGEVLDDIGRLVGVYEAMKPREAAAVLGQLPPDFAAEILMRLEPASGAAILAAVDPGQAAILTTHMGARRVPRS